MFLPCFWPRPAGLLLVVLLALNAACTRKTVSFNSRPEEPVAGELAPGDSLATTSQKAKPKLAEKAKKVRPKATKEEEQADKAKQLATQATKQAKRSKKFFLAERIKKAYVKSGSKGKNQVIEVFYYLRTFKQPNPMAPARYYYSPRKHKIFKASGELDAATDKVLHGPYKKLQNNKVLETGYYALGTKHLRWERYDQKGGLVAKSHFEMGFPRDANISYYDGKGGILKEVVPYVNGKLEGDYVKYLADGQRDWTGQFENGHRVGEWTNYWGYKNYRRYVYQYGESGYDPEITEPELVREYTHGGTVIYDKEKSIDRRNEAETDAAGTTKSDPRRPGGGRIIPKTAPAPKKDTRRPGYHPKIVPPPVPATPGGTAEPAGTQ
ncbi:MAG: toxin-antitoxin system YwqK family antitoxin [Janthinobacterium lividum]